MVRHIILWQLKDELTEKEKQEISRKIKEGLEGLKGKVPGLMDVHVQIDHLPSSNADIMLDSTVEDEAALKVYAGHPEHLKVKDGLIAPNTKSRVCIDFEV